MNRRDFFGQFTALVAGVSLLGRHVTTYWAPDGAQMAVGADAFDTYTGALLIVTSGQLAGTSRLITEYTPQPIAFTFAAPMPAGLRPSDTFEIWPASAIPQSGMAYQPLC